MITDQKTLMSSQYQDSSNLNARMSLHVNYSRNKVNFHGWVFDHFELESGQRVLEVGCGPGTLWTQNLSRIPDGVSVALSDMSAGMVSEARSNVRTGRSQADFRYGVADAQALPFGDGAFDVAVANHMLYHVPDRPQAISELARVLKPGGRLFATTVGLGHMSEIRELEGILLGEGKEVPVFDTFTLTNGEDQLSGSFQEITLDLVDNELVVPDPEPVIAYVLSMNAAAGVSETQVRNFRATVENRMARNGPMRISIETGMFQAVRP